MLLVLHFLLYENQGDFIPETYCDLTAAIQTYIDSINSLLYTSNITPPTDRESLQLLTEEAHESCQSQFQTPPRPQ